MKAKGFSLIELLIAVAIVGIIAKIAYPSYLEHIQKARRSQAEAALISLANALEMYKMQNGGKYTAGTDPTAAGLLSDQVPVSGGGTKIYSLAITTVTTSTYLLTATPVQTDSKCGNLTYTQAGVKAASTGATDCW